MIRPDINDAAERAEAYEHGLIKDIENRDWLTKVRGRVWIHAGKVREDEDVWIEGNFGIKVPKDLPLGGIVGSVEIVDCVRESSSQWFFGEYGFVLRDAKPCEFIPMRGQLGFFPVQIVKEG